MAGVAAARMAEKRKARSKHWVVEQADILKFGRDGWKEETCYWRGGSLSPYSPRDDAYRPLKLVPRERNIDLSDPLWGLTLTPRRPTLRDITRELIGGESLGGTWTLELSHCWHVAE